MMSLTRHALFAAAAAFAPAAACHADMVAQWIFSSGTEADLTADVGDFTLSSASNGVNDQLTFNAGAVTIGDGRLLYATGINSNDMPEMTTGATVWARVKVPSAASDALFLGLINEDGLSSSYEILSLTARRLNNTLLPYGRTNTLSNISPSSSGAPLPNDFVDVALVFKAGFNANGNPSPSNSRIELYVDGEFARAHAAGGTAMQAFQSLGLGRLRGADGVNVGGDLIVDEVRVYNEILTAEQISAIPEPAAGALLGMGGLLLVRRRAGGR